MRLLLLHSDFVEYEPISKEISLAENVTSIEKKRIEDVIVILVAIESGDDESTVSAAVHEIKEYANLVKGGNILIYPYAHLSPNLALPQQALELLLSLEISIGKEFSNVARAPFGWTKSFSIKVKGHPLAENSKIISGEKAPGVQRIEDSVSNALKAEKRQKSSWYILNMTGDLIPLEKFDFTRTSNNLKILADYEVSKSRAVDETPPHVRLMKKLGIADYEPASDSGNLRFYPKGRLMKSLIEAHVSSRISEYGGIEVETPIMYDSQHPALRSYFNRFPARQYNLASDNKQLFLRFAACFGQFLMAKDFQISYKNLPLRLYELTRYSFRREKTGELVGLRRLRAFSMPDCHAFCKDMEQAKEELLKRVELSLRVITELGICPDKDIEMAVRFTRQFYEENRNFIHSLVNKFKKPVLIEMWEERFFYFILKWEFNFIDSLRKAAALSTDQIDVENGQRYDIQYVDENNARRFPIILHNSPSGAVERVIYVLLEKAAISSRLGKVPSFPLWLTHTQVRLIPVSTKHTEYCEVIVNKFGSNRIRADIDDREESVGKKIRDSETEWIYYTLVIGDNELDSDQVVVRDRETKSQYKISIEDLIKRITSLLTERPYLPLNLPVHLSERPKI